MALIGFVGLGNMGAPMAGHLLAHGHHLRVFDLAEAAVAQISANGAEAATSAMDSVKGAEFIITMLPEGRHVRSVYLGEDGIVAHADSGAQLIDCSTIDVDTARAVNEAALERGLDMLDAPVSGGVIGAEAASLTFMVGGSEAAFARARPVLEQMGKAVIHAGGSGNGQAAKVCNNMMLAISMIGTAEAFTLGQRLGLDAQTLFDISSKSSGQSWAMTNHCPVPGPVPNSAANRGYAPGFAAALMAKDLRLSQQAADATGSATPLGAAACQLYRMFEHSGRGGLDYSAIVKMLEVET